MDDESSRGSENAIFLLWKHGAKEDAPAKMTRIYYLTLPFFMSWLRSLPSTGLGVAVLCPISALLT